MNNVKVLQNQSLLDIAIQEYGNLNNIVQLAAANNISVTTILSPGQVLILPDLEKDTFVTSLFESRTMKPATGISNKGIEEITTTDCGIGCMSVEQTFFIA